ncbi:MAG: DNA-processing protein DprA, partial [Bacteroidales bacterium]|nr:DNA-processing protein DprA [Bacteroidales bacterium]
VFKEKKQNLLKIPGIGKLLAEEVFNKEVHIRTEEEIKFIEKHRIQTFFFTDKNYPHRLKQCEDSPILLYYKGSSDLNQQKIISIVGTRKASQYGLENCKKLIADLSEKGYNILIVSGLAYGIDVAAHKSALKSGQETIAVLGHGLNMIYPAAHRNIAQDIVKQGGLLTELSSSAVLDPGHFVKRNRIIAGLADATIVIESGKKGGSLITAKIANDYHKDVFAFPGRVNDKYSEGCNKLIKTNQASLIESAEDIEYLLGWSAPKKGEATQSQLFIELNKEEELVVNYLKEHGKTTLDILAVQSNMPVSKISSILLKLEFAGAVSCYPGKVFAATG